MAIYGIVGAGGFGREVMPVAHDNLSLMLGTGFELVFVVEFGATAPINGHRVLTADEFLALPGRRQFNIAVSDSAARERIATRFIQAGAVPFSVQAPTSLCMDGNTLGEGLIQCPFSTITSNAKLGRFVHLNIYSYVAHNCIVGDFVTIAPNVCCNGGVMIEDHAYIGTGAIIRNGTPEKPIVIGRGAVVGMGAVVTKSVPPGVTVIGNPALVMGAQR